MGALLEEYRRQRRIGLEGNVYHKTQVELAYNSNHIEGSRLTEEQTRQIFETNTVDGHARLDDIQDGNGRVGRMVMFKECLRNGVLPFIVADDKKQFYYRGLSNYEEEPGWLLDTCRSFQDDYQVRFLPLVPNVKVGV